MITANTPTSLPSALQVIKRLEEEIRGLKQALKYDLLPAWVIHDIMAENSELHNVLRGNGIIRT